jgi:hypothetical protein
MREGTIKYQFPLKKGMEHFPRKINKLLFDSIIEQIMSLMLHLLMLLDSQFSAPSSKALKKSTIGR